MRLVEIRLYDGPSVYRLAPVARVEVAVGRGRTWHGDRDADAGSLVVVAATAPAREWPDPVTDLVAWLRRLRTEHGETGGPIEVHRGTDAGRWVVTFPWLAGGRAKTIAEAAFDLAARSVSPARRTRLTGTQVRTLERWGARIAEARTAPPSWIRDEERRLPVISITGTNGKSTVTRLVTHILQCAGRHVGTTTSDGILVDEQLVDAGDWTGPGGAAAILRRDDVDIAVLETARGGLVLRGMGYESNDASIFTNVSSDHLDLQGIHTLAELTEVKATVCRVTKPSGTVILNADDPYVAAVARRVRATVAWFSLTPSAHAHLARHRRSGGRAYVLRDGRLLEWDGADEHPIADVAELPVTLGGFARHNVANALAAAAGARALGATIDEVATGLRDFRPTAELSPGRCNLFRLGGRTIVVDFAHNEAGTDAILDVAEALATSGPGRAPVTAIIGTAGDRPDDTLRGIGRIAATRADHVVIKETPAYLRGRTREEVIRVLRDGIAEASVNPDTVPVHGSETAALAAEIDRPGGDGVIVLFCHEERAAVFELLGARGAHAIDVATELPAILGGRARSG